MADSPLLDAITMGLKGELDSVTVYADAASRADGEVAAFFLERVAEEKRHYNWLLGYYQDLVKGATPGQDIAKAAAALPGTSPILSEDFLRRIGSSQALSTAVATAVLLEAKAMRHYADAAQTAPAGALRDFFNALSKWETRHYEELIKVQDESRRYWFDAHHFEPF